MAPNEAAPLINRPTHVITCTFFVPYFPAVLQTSRASGRCARSPLNVKHGNCRLPDAWHLSAAVGRCIGYTDIGNHYIARLPSCLAKVWRLLPADHVYKLPLDGGTSEPSICVVSGMKCASPTKTVLGVQ